MACWQEGTGARGMLRKRRAGVASCQTAVIRLSVTALLLTRSCVLERLRMQEMLDFESQRSRTKHNSAH